MEGALTAAVFQGAPAALLRRSRGRSPRTASSSASRAPPHPLTHSPHSLPHSPTHSLTHPSLIPHNVLPSLSLADPVQTGAAGAT